MDIPQKLKDGASEKGYLEFAVQVCTAIELICPEHGYHVALTGGCLYKPGARKDIDILFYSIRQEESPHRDGLLDALKQLGFSDFTDHGWLTKARFQDRKFDMFFPETEKTMHDGESG